MFLLIKDCLFIFYQKIFHSFNPQNAPLTKSTSMHKINVTRITFKGCDQVAGKYLFVFYSLPSEPSRIRVAAWRAMKKLGALIIQQSLWMLPQYTGVDQEIKRIRESIENDGGSISIIEGEFIYGKEDIISKFNQEREKEYKELLQYCRNFHEEMRLETEKKNFIFAELEENEEELNKLIRWFAKIKKRDCFNSNSGETVEKEIEKCKSELQEFAQKIYEDNNI